MVGRQPCGLLHRSARTGRNEGNAAFLPRAFAPTAVRLDAKGIGRDLCSGVSKEGWHRCVYRKPYLPIFWTLPTSFLSGKSAAAAIGLINSIGSLAGFLGPYLMGYMKDATGNYEAGLLAIAGLAAFATAIILLLPHDKNLEFADSSNLKSGPQAADVAAR